MTSPSGKVHIETPKIPSSERSARRSSRASGSLLTSCMATIRAGSGLSAGSRYSRVRARATGMSPSHGTGTWTSQTLADIQGPSMGAARRLTCRRNPLWRHCNCNAYGRIQPGDEPLDHPGPVDVHATDRSGTPRSRHEGAPVEVPAEHREPRRRVAQPGDVVRVGSCAVQVRSSD